MFQNANLMSFNSMAIYSIFFIVDVLLAGDHSMIFIVCVLLAAVYPMLMFYW